MKHVFNADGERINNLYVNNDENLVQVDYQNCNFQMNIRNDNVEIVYYIKPFIVPKHVLCDEKLINSSYNYSDFDVVLNQRKFKSVDGIVTPIEEYCTIQDLQTSINRSVKRSKKNFYNYALSNRWDYFVTATFANADIRKDKDLLYSNYNSFIRYVRKNNPNVKALAVYERFKNRDTGYHMHFLMSECDLLLKPARDANTDLFMYSSYGNQVFNSLEWQFGHSAVVIINPDANQMQVVNYMSKYMTKESPAPYGCKRYFHTVNLDNSFNYIDNKNYDDVLELAKMLNLEVVKSNDKCIYFRKLS